MAAGDGRAASGGAGPAQGAIPHADLAVALTPTRTTSGLRR